MIKAIQISVILLICCTGCNPKANKLTGENIIYEYDKSNFMSGGCYYIENSEDCVKSQFIIEIQPYKLDTIESVISEAELGKYTLDSVNFSIPVRPYVAYFVKSNEPKAVELSKSVSPDVIICSKEIPAVKKTFTRNELISSNYKIKRLVLVEESKILKTMVSNTPIDLKENQFYFPISNWCDFKRIVWGGSHL